MKSSLFCPYDTHKKEVDCVWYEKGKYSNFGCFCKFMDADKCFCLERKRDKEKEK